MKILFIGDIVGKASRKKIKEIIPTLKSKYNTDMIIANGENATSGYGLSKKDAEELFSSGLDLLTLGNHAWDQRDMLSYIEENPKIIRALNYPDGVPGKGYYKFELLNGKKIIVVQVMLRLFMNLSLDDPFKSIIEFLQKEKLGSTCDAIIIDMHGEATSEKKAFGYYVDGQVSAVLGTHTHVPTADSVILPKGTAYQTDVGMSGDYNSIIGFDINNPIHGFVKGYRAEGRFTPATENITICGALIEIDINTGLAKNITPIQET